MAYHLLIPKIKESLDEVEEHFEEIDNKLDELKIGRKDTPFDRFLKDNMVCGYEYVDYLLDEGLDLFDKEGLSKMLELNHRVHYGLDHKLRYEYNSAIKATREGFYKKITALTKWYSKHKKKKDHPLKIASEIYVGVLGQPQLFVEGNHRTGSLIASWILVRNGYPPFVLSYENAISYFKPSAEIKKFAEKSTWRSRRKLPKYNKSFREFLEKYIDEKYLIETKR